MEEVRVSRDELLTILRKNREGHRQIFEEAVVGYRRAIVEHLESLIERIRRGSKIEHHIALPRPADHTKEYDRAIRMLEMSTENEIKISAGDFECFVMDNWRWKQEFIGSNRMYSQTAAASWTE